jgi:hypothetical protein
LRSQSALPRRREFTSHKETKRERQTKKETQIKRRHNDRFLCRCVYQWRFEEYDCPSECGNPVRQETESCILLDTVRKPKQFFVHTIFSSDCITRQDRLGTTMQQTDSQERACLIFAGKLPEHDRPPRHVQWDSSDGVGDVWGCSHGHRNVWLGLCSAFRFAVR